MLCDKCDAKIDMDDRFCRKCGTALNTGGTHNKAITGDNSFNAGQNNIITDNQIVFGTTTQAVEPIPYIKRLKITPLKIGNRPIKTAWFIWSGILTTAGSIASIWAVLPSRPNFILLFLLFFGAGFIAIATGKTLNKIQFARVPFVTNFEANEQKEVFISKIGGDCPRCTGKLKLTNIINKQVNITALICTRNPTHRWGFDPTRLEAL